MYCSIPRYDEQIYRDTNTGLKSNCVHVTLFFCANLILKCIRLYGATQSINVLKNLLLR